MEVLRPHVGYVYLLMMIALTIYGQIIYKWQMSQIGSLPAGIAEKVWFMGALMLNPWILSAFASAFLASFCWMAALTKFPLSVAYPFNSLILVAMLLVSAVLFAEPLTASKWVGMALLVAGVIVSGQKW